MEPINAIIPDNGIAQLSQAPKRSAFINANTVDVSLHEIKNEHIIPVFVKDNEPLISHYDFIEVVRDAAKDHFQSNGLSSTMLRVSHPIKGRIPEARNKRADDLKDHEKTIYYERMAFLFEIEGYTQRINGNDLNLTIGGVKAYNEDNMNKSKGSDEHFRVFIGYENTVCTNLCIWTDGYTGKIVVNTIESLYSQILQLVRMYDPIKHAEEMESLQNYGLSENEFAKLLGRCRMYYHLPMKQKSKIPELVLSDTQINQVANGYYHDENFCSNDDGNISLWNVFNLLTGANKSSYIDTFLDRSVNASKFTNLIRSSLKNEESFWFLQ